MIKIRAIARRRWSVLVAGLVLGMLAGIASSLMAPEKTNDVKYRVSQLIIANRMAQQQGNVEQDSLRVTRGSVAELALKKLGESDPDALAGSVAAVANTDTLSIEVSSTDKDPKVATARVQAYVDAFLEVINADLTGEQKRRMGDLEEQLLQAQAELDTFTKANPNVGIVPNENPLVEQNLISQRSELKNAVDSTKQQIQQERLNAKQTLPYSTLGPDAPRVVNSDLLPVPTGVPFRAGLLGIVGVALAAGLIMIIERLIPRIDTRDELIAAVELPVLAEVGYFPPRLLPRNADGTLHIEGGWAEPYRRIRSAIQFVQTESASLSGDGEVPRVFMITSASPGEGKSTTAAVTALAMAETGERTLVIGGDFRRPSIQNLLGVPQSPGIREHARLDVDRPTLDQIVHPTTHENLFVASSGKPGKEVVGLADAAKELIAEAVAEGATVIVDTSPIEVANDAIDLLPVVDHVILVVRSGRTVVKSLLHTVDQLNQHGVKIMGTALIGTPGLAKQQYYYEGYYSSEPPAGPDGQLFPEAPVGPVGPNAGGPSGSGASSAPPPFQPPSGAQAEPGLGSVPGTATTAPSGSAPLSRPAPPPMRPLKPQVNGGTGTVAVAAPESTDSP
ncbi:MAG: hypothetical protein KDB26_14880, partial [Microthrixaceae bacterium]|nr:hypothetical protein [Microthrixaceae bacterium]